MITRRVCINGFKLIAKNIMHFEVDKEKADAFTDNIVS